MTDRAIALTALRSVIAEAGLGELPALIGELEGMKAAAWVRLTMPAPGANQTEPDAGHMMTAAELARVYHVPKSWFYELARQGRLPCQRLGRYVRFDQGAVERALAADSKITALVTGKKKRGNGGLRRPATARLPESERTA